ncbi:MAG: PASTA domain-containing protein, partial [Candidatus Omnitrophica bacterium]|nr:PASTA domain-containing protein [Candidatus Omnitrophota bacterium]
MFVFTLFFVAIFSMVTGYIMYTQIGRSTTMAMPSFIGDSELVAIERINEAGLKLARLNPVRTTDHPEGIIIDQNPRPFTEVRRGRSVVLDIAESVEQTTVPDLKGIEERFALVTLGEEGLVQGKVARAFHPTQAVDSVITTYPPAGEEVPKGTSVDLLISRGPRPVAYVMPDLLARNEQEAREYLSQAGLLILPERKKVNRSSLVGKVIDQEPKPGKKLSPGEEVKLIIG